MTSKKKNIRTGHTSALPTSALGLNQWADVLDSVSDAISIHSVSGEIVWANKKLCEINSIPLSSLIGLSYEQAFHTESSTGAQDQSWVAAQTGHEVMVCERLWSVTITPLPPTDKSSGFIRVMHDVTEQRRIRLNLLDAERFASLGQMLFGIAHNVGTPLNIISGYSEYLLMRLKPDEPGHKELSAILDQTKRIAILISEALDVVRPGQTQVSAIDAKALLADALNLTAHYFRKSDVLAELTCGMSPPLIYGEAPKLRQAFFSLLMNASQDVGIGGRIEVVIAGARDKPGFLSVSLWGTRADGQGHDFSRSFKSLGDNSSEVVKSGIGLSIVKRILDDAGATMTFNGSEERGGIPIIVHLPIESGG